MPAETLDVTSMIPAKFEPKRKNRWILMVEGIDAYLIKTAGRPKITIEETEMPFINSRRYLAGKATFDTISVTLHDPIAPSGAQQVMEWVRTHYESVSGRSGYADFYKRDVQLKLLDPVGTVVELWDIKGAFIKDVGFGELTYEEDKPVEITLTLRFDNAVLQYLRSHSTKRVEKKAFSEAFSISDTHSYTSPYRIVRLSHVRMHSMRQVVRQADLPLSSLQTHAQVDGGTAPPRTVPRRQAPHV